MTDEDIKSRLQDTAAACLKCYEAWRGQEKDSAASQALQDAVHELRKVASRLEIELAISERDETAQKKIPIPAHRDARKNQQASGDNDEYDDFNGGNGNASPVAKKPGAGRPRRKPGPAPKKEAGGEG